MQCKVVGNESIYIYGNLYIHRRDGNVSTSIVSSIVSAGKRYVINNDSPFNFADRVQYEVTRQTMTMSNVTCTDYIGHCLLMYKCVLKYNYLLSGKEYESTDEKSLPSDGELF